MPPLSQVASEKLAALEEKHLRRQLVANDDVQGIWVMRGGKKLLSFCSNDYLGLSQHPATRQAAADAALKHGTGAGASRLVSGNSTLYEELERSIARWKGTEAALVFGSGYLANVGLIPALAGRGDMILADRLIHACMLDGAKLSDAKLLRFKHNDVADCERLLKQHRAEYGQCFILTEGVFSMDGDLAPLEALLALAETYDATVICDDAHALGVINQGRGSAPNNMRRFIGMGTLSKAVGSYGGYVCAPRSVIDYLVSSARSLIFSTGLPPAVLAASLAAFEVMGRDAERIARPLRLARMFTEQLNLPPAESSIVPILIGEAEAALKASAQLQEQGFLVAAIRPPTVPQGTARLRVTLSALHDEAQVQSLARAIRRLDVL